MRGDVAITKGHDFPGEERRRAQLPLQLLPVAAGHQVVAVHTLRAKEGRGPRHVQALQPPRNFVNRPSRHRFWGRDFKHLGTHPSRGVQAEYKNILGIREPVVGGAHVEVLRTRIQRDDHGAARERESIAIDHGV